MLVYGDHSSQADPRERLDALGTELERIAALPAGLGRHSALVGSLIDGGRLLQGVADADFAECGHDRRTEAADALSDFLRLLAAAVQLSWDSGFTAEIALPAVPRPDQLPRSVELKAPEGYAYYALYPEAYLEAARTLALAGTPYVIGIRSIGTSLAAMVAAALHAPGFITIRPRGDAAERRLAIAPELAGEIVGGDRHYVIVDEGPGLSGSTFGAIADWLQDRGVPLSRIAFMPSHPQAPGRQACDARRARWNRVQKAVADLGPRLPQFLECWAADLLGPLDGPLADISAGAWRRIGQPDVRTWPAVNPGWERRKYLARAKGETWLIKFAGLGSIGERKLALGRTLHAAGLVPEPRGLVHGFFVERWHGDAAQLDPWEKPVSEIARYIGTRARLLPAPAGSGASLAALLATAKRNSALAVGEEIAAFDAWAARVPALEERQLRVETDNRLDRHEWLRIPGGALLKCDALDHCAAHDLVGCQDFAWDVAGAAVEFDLDQHETARLAAAAGDAAGRLVDPELLELCELLYLAFRLGHARLSIEMCRADAAEALRLAVRAERYGKRLHQRLIASAAAAPAGSEISRGPERAGAGTIVPALG